VSALVFTDPDLGTVRYCRRCDDWWPMDAEFFAVQVRPVGMRNTSRGRSYALRTPCTVYTCLACRREQQRIYARERRESSRRMRA